MTIPTMTLGWYWSYLPYGFTFVEGRQHSFSGEAIEAQHQIEHWCKYWIITEQYQRRGYGVILINRKSVTPTVVEALRNMGYEEGKVIQIGEVALGIFDEPSRTITWIDCGGKYVRPVLNWLGYTFQEV